LPINPLPVPGLEPNRVQGFLHPWGRLAFRLSSPFSRAPVLPCPRALLFLLSLAPLLLCSPSAVHAQPIWGPDTVLTNYPRGTAYHPQIAVCQDTLHVVWYEDWVDSSSTEYVEVMYKRSTDRGQTWTSDTVLSPISPGWSLMSVIAVSGPVVHVAWYEEVGDSVLYIRSTDSGRSWNGLKTLTPAGFASDMNVIGDTVLMFWGTTTASYLSMSTDAGLTWQPARPSPGGWASSVWPYIHIVCQKDTAIPPVPEIYHQRSSDGGASWSQAAMISERDVYGGQWPDIFADQNGNPHIVWFDYKHSPYPWTGDIFYRTSLDTGNTWELIDSLTVEHRATASDIVGLGDTLHLVWEDERFYPVRRYSEIYYRFSSDLGKTWGPETRLTYDSLDSRTPQLAVSPSGVYLVWGDNRGNPPGGYEVYFKRGSYGSGVEVDQKGSSYISDFKVFPNPSRGLLWLWGDNIKEASIFDLTGKLIRCLTSGRGADSRKASVYLFWDGRDERGKEVKSGVYFIRIRSGKGIENQKIVILKGGKP